MGISYFKLLTLLFVSFYSYAEEVANPTFIDKDGDKIIILDHSTREKLNEKQEIAASNVYDNQTDLNQYKKTLEKDILSLDNEKFSYYTLEKDETLDSLALKLYGDKQKAKEIQILNELKIKDERMKAGMVIKYKNPNAKGK